MSDNEGDYDAFVGFCVIAGLLTGVTWLIGFGTVGGWLAAAATGVLSLAWSGFAWAATLALTTVLQTVATAAAVIVGGVLARRYLFKKKSSDEKWSDEEAKEILQKLSQREKQ